MCIQPLPNISNHVVITHGVPHAIRGYHYEFPLTIQMEGLDLRHSTYHLLPRRLFMLGFQQEVSKTSSRNEDASHPAKQQKNRPLELEDEGQVFVASRPQV